MADPKIHPVANLLPMLNDDELNELVESIKVDGLMHPIVLDKEGLVLDGRNRLLACKQAGVKPEFTTYDGDHPTEFAFRANARRRQLTKGQLAMYGARTFFLRKNEDEDEPTDENAGDFARAIGISGAHLSRAKTVIEHGSDMVDNVVSGDMPLNEAYEKASTAKKNSKNREFEMEKLRLGSPDLAAMVEEGRLSLLEAQKTVRQRDADRDANLRTQANRISDTIVGFPELLGLQDNPDRDDIIGKLPDQQQRTLATIEKEYLWKKDT